MMDITRLSSLYDIRVLDDSDVDEILRLYRQNPLFYKHTDAWHVKKMKITTFNPQIITKDAEPVISGC